MRLSTTHRLREVKYRRPGIAPGKMTKRTINKCGNAACEVVLLEKLCSVYVTIKKGVETKDRSSPVLSEDGWPRRAE